MIFQEPMTALNPVMTIGRQVAECGAAHGLASGRELKRKAMEALDRLETDLRAQSEADQAH